MHPVVALEKSTLRRISWNFPFCCRVSPKLSASPDFYMQSDLMRKRNLSVWEKIDSSLQVATWTQLFLLFCSCILFAIVEQLSELKFLVQQVELKWLTLHEWKRLFHSSCVKFPLVSLSASWFLVSMQRIWIFGSKLILSNSPSRATLLVRETCLVVGLRPLIMILITASCPQRHTT